MRRLEPLQTAVPAICALFPRGLDKLGMYYAAMCRFCSPYCNLDATGSHCTCPRFYQIRHTRLKRVPSPACQLERGLPTILAYHPAVVSPCSSALTTSTVVFRYANSTDHYRSALLSNLVWADSASLPYSFSPILTHFHCRRCKAFSPQLTTRADPGLDLVP